MTKPAAETPELTNFKRQESIKARFQQKIDDARAEHGEVLQVVVKDKLFLFRKPNTSELVSMNKSSRKQPELAIIHAIGLCRNCFIGPTSMSEFEEMTNAYTLLFAGAEDFKSVSDHLIDMAKGDAIITLS
jgi:hypothetical protein